MDSVANSTQRYSLAATNHFFKCLTEALAADLRFLAQPGYVPASQIAQSLHQGVSTYLTSNAYTNNLQMFQAAQQALNQFKQDPACGLAKMVPGAAAAAIAHLGSAVAEANAAESAANAASRIANANTERQVAYGAGPGRANPLAFNPSGAENMCFPAAVAQQLTWATGEPLFAVPFEGNVGIQILDGVPTKVFNITQSPTIHAMLRGLFGSEKLQGPALSAERLANQAAGIPSVVNSVGDFVTELKNAKSGSRLMAFIDYPPSAQNAYATGHVVNARNVLNKIIIVDPSNGLSV
jgi:hypothetical protein